MSDFVVNIVLTGVIVAIVIKFLDKIFSRQMIKFNFSAEWPLGANDVDWLKNGYFPLKLNDAIRQIKEVRAVDGHAFDPYRNGPMVNGAEANVFLKADNWVSSTAPNGAAGQFFHNGVSGNSAIPDIWINWNREFDITNNLYGRIVRHELIHMLLWLQYPPIDLDFVRYDNEWQNSQHGKLAPDKDIFILALNKQINDYFPLNNSQFPGKLPCGS